MNFYLMICSCNASHSTGCEKASVEVPEKDCIVDGFFLTVTVFYDHSSFQLLVQIFEASCSFQGGVKAISIEY